MPTTAGTSWPLEWNVFDTWARSRATSPPAAVPPAPRPPAAALISPIRSQWWQRVHCPARRRRSAGRPRGTGRSRAGSGRRRRTSAAACRSAAACPGSSRAGAPTCGSRGAAATGAARPCTGVAVVRRRAIASPSSTILPAYITPTRSHIVRMTPRLWAISRTAGVHLGHERANEVEDARLDRRVETGRRLVEDEQLRVGGERDRDHDPLLHAARQLVRVALVDPFRIRDLDAAHGGQCALSRLLRRLAEDRERLGDLRADLGRRVQRGAGVLVDHRRVVGPELADLLVVHPRDVVAPTRIRPPVMTALRGR